MESAFGAVQISSFDDLSGSAVMAIHGDVARVIEMG